QGELIARREEPAAHAVDAEVGAQVGRASPFGAGRQHVGGVLLAGADRGPSRAGDRAAEATPRRTGALIERRRLQITPAILRVVGVLVEDDAARWPHVANRVACRGEPDA